MKLKRQISAGQIHQIYEAFFNVFCIFRFGVCVFVGWKYQDFTKMYKFPFEFSFKFAFEFAFKFTFDFTLFGFDFLNPFGLHGLCENTKIQK